MAWQLTVRAGPRVRRASFDDLQCALDELEARGRELQSSASGDAVDVKFKRFEAQQRVIARLELAGPQRFVPSVRAGIDVRGDGSIEAYHGRTRRAIIPERGNEDAYAVLRRSLSQR
ncbi:MAG: hypothetical protein ACRDL8_17605 [Solirubrobacteraceae bacterium]